MGTKQLHAKGDLPAKHYILLLCVCEEFEEEHLEGGLRARACVCVCVCVCGWTMNENMHVSMKCSVDLHFLGGINKIKLEFWIKNILHIARPYCETQRVWTTNKILEYRIRSFRCFEISGGKARWASKCGRRICKLLTLQSLGVFELIINAEPQTTCLVHVKGNTITSTRHHKLFSGT